MLGLLFRSPHRRATSSGSTSLNSPFIPSHVIQLALPLSESSSNRNCHNWICPLPESEKIHIRFCLFVVMLLLFCFVFLFIYLFIYLFFYLFIFYLFIYFFFIFFIYLFIYFFFFLFFFFFRAGVGSIPRLKVSINMKCLGEV